MLSALAEVIKAAMAIAATPATKAFAGIRSGIRLFNERSWARGRGLDVCKDRRRVCRSGADPGRLCRPGCGAEIWRHANYSALGQPGQHVDPRGNELFGHCADDGGLQQSRSVPPGQGTERYGQYRPRSRRELVVERGRQGTDLQIAPGRQMA